jgi:hypothetical protein
LSGVAAKKVASPLDFTLARDLLLSGCMKNERKEMIDDERGYFFGFARGTYGEVLGELSKTRVNSWRTSSIPLAEFWQPANLGRIGRLLYNSRGRYRHARGGKVT